MTQEVPTTFGEAFEELYRLAYRVAYRLLGDRGDSEDVAQEALARAMVRWKQLEDKPEGWLSRVAANLAIDRIRRRKRQLALTPGSSAIVDPYVGERGDLVAALRHLPRRQREVVVLRYLADMSEAHVAIELGCSVGTVKSHGARALAALRSELAETQQGDVDVRTS